MRQFGDFPIKIPRIWPKYYPHNYYMPSRERGLALAGPASRQNSATAEAACKQHAGRYEYSALDQSALAQWDKSLGVRT
jgi:hypothetical protein